MTANPLLSIVLPTYNRAPFLDHCLGIHIPLIKEHNIEIFVSDNGSTDATAEVVEKYRKIYPLIRYHRNETNLGADKNFQIALGYPETAYVWLLGDTYRIPESGIDYLLNLLKSDGKSYDLVAFNVGDRVVDVPRQDYSDQNKLLSDLGWHLTCMSTLVYSSGLLKSAEFKRYENTCLIQTGIIFEYLAGKKFLVHWVGDLSVQGISLDGLAKGGWQDQTLEIWVNNWANMVLSLPPSYSLDAKLKCIKDHGTKARILTFSALRRLRRYNILNYQAYKKYVCLFPLTVVSPRWTVLVLCLLPRFCRFFSKKYR